MRAAIVALGEDRLSILQLNQQTRVLQKIALMPATVKPSLTIQRDTSLILAVNVSSLSYLMFLVQISDYVALKLRGLPFQIKANDISFFFSDYEHVPNSVFLGKNQDGRRTGFGTILFENEEECKRAMSEKQGQNIGHRYIELYVISYGDYLEFKNSQTSYNVVKLGKYITSVNKKRALVMRGLPFKVSVEDI